VAKHVFKSISIKDIGKPITIDAGSFEAPEVKKEIVEAEEVMGTSLEELEAEIEEKRRQFEDELSKKKANFEEEIQKTQRDAENWAFEKVKEANEQYETKVHDADDQAKSILSQAQKEADQIIKIATEEAARKENDAYKKGYDEGREEGFTTGKDEVDRLITRLNIILSSAIKKRNEIIEEAESQIIDIVITIARKVVKSITESQKRVVYDNISEALKKLKGRAEVTIRVNSEDLQMTTKHKKEFIQMVEGIEQVRILEDNTVDKGGCYISTDFGSIDARISTQLSEIEEQIKKISPVKEEL